MTIIEIFLIGVALSMDAFAVSLSSAMVYTNLTPARSLSMPAAFGLFQGLMPVAGFYLGSLFSDIINNWSGPIALVILGFIGINMIREGLSENEDVSKKELTFKLLILQAIATSIDAFAVGVSFAASGAPILKAAPIIALTTFSISLAAVFIGGRLGEKLGEKAEIFGGIILICIGIKSMFF
ncbi:MAG: manganese efflux pump MntP family protein [bacterium]|nr:manganese efflux pump MntP family protein [bacterium]